MQRKTNKKTPAFNCTFAGLRFLKYEKSFEAAK
jgi:hypothetical protein